MLLRCLVCARHSTKDSTYINSQFSPKRGNSIIFSIFQLRKLQFREVKFLVPDTQLVSHAGKSLSWSDF